MSASQEHEHRRHGMRGSDGRIGETGCGLGADRLGAGSAVRRAGAARQQPCCGHTARRLVRRSGETRFGGRDAVRVDLRDAAFQDVTTGMLHSDLSVPAPWKAKPRPGLADPQAPVPMTPVRWSSRWLVGPSGQAIWSPHPGLAALPVEGRTSSRLPTAQAGVRCVRGTLLRLWPRVRGVMQ